MGMNDQERRGSQALPGCSATTDVILALIRFLFFTQAKETLRGGKERHKTKNEGRTGQ